MIILDITVCILCLIFGNSIRDRFSIFNSYDKNLLKQLFWYHIMISVVFYFYIITFGGDAELYWIESKLLSFNYVWESVLTVGRPTQIIMLLYYFPSNVLGLSFFTGNILSGLLGYLGFTYFLAILKTLIPDYHYLRTIKVLNISIFPLLLFLPNLHFWSAGVGKDSILFFAIVLFAYSFLNIKKRLLGLVFSLLLSFFLRPHITLFLLVGFGIGFVFSKKMPVYKRVFFTALFTLAFSFIFSSVLSFVSIEEFTTENVQQFSTNKAAALSSSGGSIVDISGYPYPLKVLTFLYRPFFFDINNPLALVASFENLLLVILTIKFLRRKPIKTIRQGSFIIKGSLIFFLLGAFSFSLILGNLGIMLRQKNMFMLLFFVVILYSFYINDIQPKLKSKYGN
jgi:hypothetical protein